MPTAKSTRWQASRHVGRGAEEGNLWESFIVGCKVMHAKRKDGDGDDYINVDRGDKGLVGAPEICGASPAFPRCIA